ncbi:hypothetical protein [Mesomycoplasma ovipneumoniae]|uniref:hypothetical protein n=1 Tax=Mesomycoplasma ovipneumoniae TaxID=29562 RepID=UPI0028A94A26|nr:hypothetical protein [Mesomycoplasma ovipneumoniae]WNM14642.1 hypothetical protein RNM01_02745 [Mesomycoplasma ovipneumoniae]
MFCSVESFDSFSCPWALPKVAITSWIVSFASLPWTTFLYWIFAFIDLDWLAWICLNTSPVSLRLKENHNLQGFYHYEIVKIELTIGRVANFLVSSANLESKTKFRFGLEVVLRQHIKPVVEPFCLIPKTRNPVPFRDC